MKFFSHDNADLKIKAGVFMADIKFDANVKASTVIHAFQSDDEVETWYP